MTNIQKQLRIINPFLNQIDLDKIENLFNNEIVNLLTNITKESYNKDDNVILDGFSIEKQLLTYQNKVRKYKSKGLIIENNEL